MLLTEAQKRRNKKKDAIRANYKKLEGSKMAKYQHLAKKYKVSIRNIMYTVNGE